jgi:cbb3-type cytochrome oxidase subunit 3
MSDIMGNMDLTTYPIIGLVIFLTVFVAVSVRAVSRRHTGEYRRAAAMPLDDGTSEQGVALAPASPATAERAPKSTGVRS